MTSREQMVEKAAQAIANVENGGNVEHSDRDVAAVVLDAILPQVSTVAELEALPDDTVLTCHHGQPFWLPSDRDELVERIDAIAPLTVAWQPEVTA